MNMTKKGFIFTDEFGFEEIVMASSLAEATSKLPDSYSYETYYNEDLYHIVKMGDDKKWEILNSYWTYESADEVLDVYSEEYPYTLVDILYKGEVVD